MGAAENYFKLIDSKTSIQDKLNIIEDITRQRLAVLLGVEITQIPVKFEYIVTDIVGARYARIGNEGVTSYSQDGLSISFPDDDFGAYMAEINGFKNGDDFYKPRKGGFAFL